jgi:DNA-binding MarR family transcriptional regulator
MSGQKSTPEKEREFIDVLERLSLRLMQALNTFSPKPENSAARLRVLKYLLVNGPTEMSAVARALGVSKATMTTLADSLARTFQLERRADENDRRKQILAIPKGLLKYTQKELDAFYSEANLFLGCDSEKERQQFLAVCLELIKRAEQRLDKSE